MKTKKIKFTKTIKNKWIKALRSGEYEQNTSGYLKNDVGYCCLGVLGELCGVNLNSFGQTGWLKDSISCKTPTKFVGNFNLINEPSELKDKNTHISQKLAYFNDRGESFNWIANYIEKYVKTDL